MKLISRSLILLAVVLALAATGCKRKTPPITDLNRGSQAGGQRVLDDGRALANPDGPFTGQNGGGDLPDWDPDMMNQDRAALAAQTVYFDYDSSSVRSSEYPKLEAVAAALRSDSSARLLIEGHCDERGTEEYNRSLGERRALAAREVLAGMGVAPNRMATRSYGEDRPADPGSNETAWRLNRRGEFVLLHAR
jgi:peptidoglycan-associated lipoprotein